MVAWIVLVALVGPHFGAAPTKWTMTGSDGTVQMWGYTRSASRELYLAVLEWVYEEIRTQERKLNLEGLPPEKAIKKLIESSFDHLAAHPDFILLLNDENRGGARHVRGSRKLEAMHSPLVSMVSKILGEGVRAGTFRKGINPVHLYISIAGLSYFFFSNTPTLSAIFGKDLSSAAARGARRKHVVDLVMQSLRP